MNWPDEKTAVASRGGGRNRYAGEYFRPARELSGWLIPLAVFVVTAILSAFFLAYYFAPIPQQFPRTRPAPTDSGALVMLSVAGQGFHIPANYILFAADRQGGELEELSLIALFPGLQGYTLTDAQEFTSNAPDAHVIYMGIRKERVTLSPDDRLTRIYRPLIARHDGTNTSAGTMRYEFRDNSGYHGEELYVREAENGTTLIRCTRPTVQTPSPNCLGDISLGDGLVATYRFKRAHVVEWPDIESGARALLGAFMVKSRD
jgi:hypothetical protein